MMKAREAKAGPPPSADLLPCLPSRPHWPLMPKPICSPGRASESNKHRRRLGKSSAQANPLLWAKAKSPASDDTAEPTSPKVTCVGQIKVRPNTAACGNWQSMMDEIEKIHDDRKQRKRSNWSHSLGFKTEIVHFLTCLRTLRFDMRCFGSFPAAGNTTEDDDDEEEDGYRESDVGIDETGDGDASRAVFSKWFMMLQENQKHVFDGEDAKNEENGSDEGPIAESAAPPPNALMLMRCRSAPAEGWFREKGEEEKEDETAADKEKVENLLVEKEETKEENMVMIYDYDESAFYSMSSDIAKESWMVGRLRDPLSKSRSWKI